ncbi:hypothetical protein BABA_14417 [Neobacillus bataviensis LMG 21833]|uniref:Uncharacterized protein n=1 Tax=Neobacillus bataviensis LMG 21833 TaxID=1117379 RepID=K6DEC2_9BACI|nr:hypothetical protein [Neobacillus bataviensis]EKN66659.1 hypothetical protein BABA_14417 [Neobacillus bataviensis LMG 21833]
MKYYFSNKDLGFLSFLFHHPLPLIVEDPFDGWTKVQIQKEWQLFIENFRSSGLLHTDDTGNVTLDDRLIEALLCVFGADMIISLVEETEIHSVFYLQDADRGLLRKTDIGFTLEHFEHEEDFIQTFLAMVNSKETAFSNAVERFSFQLQTSQFDELLSWYTQGEVGKINTFCNQSLVNADVCISILHALHLPECQLILTERINEPGTITTRIANESGILKLVKIIHTEEKDITTLLKCSPSELTNTILDF